ncbi:hypothetical protein O9G_005404 [Rozella allomycis CSF55]|uniref:Uncharacterized protein n=1 Tax=Rozella allomycis (strain CSF55) TaxID=988480 RepID=A0A075B3U1_ROZAC|nr:hypothetical protein O9G_005404 [Rozella allomycis CSF55]|eukprot:EPZ35767.1 hypothetical protein O9G_005404 [Rozella allomycis CSF55]
MDPHYKLILYLTRKYENSTMTYDKKEKIFNFTFGEKRHHLSMTKEGYIIPGASVFDIVDICEALASSKDEEKILPLIDHHNLFYFSKGYLKSLNLEQINSIDDAVLFRYNNMLYNAGLLHASFLLDWDFLAPRLHQQRIKYRKVNP